MVTEFANTDASDDIARVAGISESGESEARKTTKYMLALRDPRVRPKYAAVVMKFEICAALMRMAL